MKLQVNKHTEQGKMYLVKHNCVTIGVFSDYNGQLHVSACTVQAEIFSCPL